MIYQCLLEIQRLYVGMVLIIFLGNMARVYIYIVTDRFFNHCVHAIIVLRLSV